MDQLCVLRYLIEYDHYAKINQPSSEKRCQRSMKKSTIPTITMKTKEKYKLMMDVIQA